MQIVLLDDIVNLGEAGEIVEVKNGYGRNYLIPQGLAERATKDAINRISLIKRAADAKRAKRMSEAAGKFALVAGKTLVITMKAGTESRIFGAVTSAMIADEIKIQFDVDIERRHIMLDEPIKLLGEFNVPLKASSEVTGEVKLVVEPEVKSADIEKKLIAQDRADREAAEAAKAVEETQAEDAAEAADIHEKYEEHDEVMDAQAPEPEG